MSNALKIESKQDLVALKKVLAGAPVELRLVVNRDLLKAAVTTLSEEPRPHLRRLDLTDADFEPGSEAPKAALTEKAAAALWAALPGLVELNLKGHAFCKTISHDTLQRLSVEGFACGDGVPPGGSCPALESLRWHVVGDEHGVAMEPAALKPLWAGKNTPALTTLDLSGADIDGEILSDKAFKKSPLRTRLVVLGLPRGEESAWQAACEAMPQLTRIIVTDSALAGVDPRVVVVEVAAAPAQPGAPIVRLEFVTDEVLTKARLETRPPPLRSLRLFSHDLEDAGAALLGRVAAAHPELEVLNLARPQIYGLSPTSLKAFQSSIGRHPGLKHLNFDQNRLEGSGDVIAALLQQLPDLEVLILPRLTGADIVTVLPALSSLTTLKEVHLNWSEPTADTATAFRQFSSTSLSTLELGGNGIDGIEGLGSRFPQLTHLTLNFLGVSELKRLAASLQGHVSLRSLSLAIEPSGAAWEALGELLQGSTIEALTLTVAKEITDDAVPDDGQGIHALTLAPRLTSLTLHIDKKALSTHQALVGHFKAMPLLRHLSGWNPDIEDVAVGRALTDALAQTGIRELTNSSMNFGLGLMKRNTLEAFTVNSMSWLDESLVALAPFMASTTSLHTLHLVRGQLTGDKAKALLAVVGASPALRKLDVSMAISAPVVRDLIKRSGKIGHLTHLRLQVPLGSDLEALQALAPRLTCDLRFFEY